MKKGVSAFILVSILVIFILLAMSFVSANWFTDFIDSFKGKPQLSSPPRLDVVANAQGSADNIATIEIRRASDNQVLDSNNNVRLGLQVAGAFSASFPSSSSANILDIPIYIYIKDVNGYKDFNGINCPFTLTVSGGVVTKTITLETGTGTTQCTSACTKEAKICPDGSSVGRNPALNCEFDPCPGSVTCTPSWTCNPASWDNVNCVNGVKTRTCTDSNNCGVITNKPSEIQSCPATSGEYTGLPAGFTPRFGYWHRNPSAPATNKGVLVLWDANGRVYYSTNGVNFALWNDAGAGGKDIVGLPRDYKPTYGWYQGFSGKETIILSDSNRVMYLWSYVIGKYTKISDRIGNAADTKPGELPYDFVPKTGYWHNLGTTGGRVSLFDATKWYIAASDSVFSQINPVNYNLPGTGTPKVSYYYEFSTAQKGVQLWYEINGQLKLYNWSQSENKFNLISPTGLPTNQVLTAGYFDNIRKKIVLWYGADAYESTDGATFTAVERVVVAGTTTLSVHFFIPASAVDKSGTVEVYDKTTNQLIISSRVNEIMAGYSEAGVSLAVPSNKEIYILVKDVTGYKIWNGSACSFNSGTVSPIVKYITLTAGSGTNAACTAQTNTLPGVPCAPATERQDCPTESFCNAATGFCQSGAGGTGGGGGDIEGVRAYPGLPAGFIPKFGYWHPYGGGAIVLWNESGAAFIYRGNTGRFTQFTTKVAEGLPADFKPVIGYYQGFPGNDSILLWNANREIYFRNTTGKMQRLSSSTGGGSGEGGKLPGDFIPTDAYWHPLEGHGGRIVLWNGSDRYVGYGNGTFANVLFNQGGLPTNKIPNLGYYSNLTGDDAVYLWYLIVGTINSPATSGSSATAPMSIGLYKSNSSSGGNYINVIGELSGLPSGVPSVGYVEKINNKVVLWYGDDAYESSDGRTFVKIEACPEGQTRCEDGQCSANCEGPPGRNKCLANTGNGISSEVPGKTRVKSNDNKVWYCDPATLVYKKAGNSTASCLNDYECESNVCIEGVCGAFKEQTGLLKSIWAAISCFIQHPFNSDSRNQCIQAAGG
ncbi:hypothetical protein HYW74_01510 [Candidatus Pacearchaeota archaeon]|nr:hypothetical protein [Candidatus Pacearchaeota archaeon]